MISKKLLSAVFPKKVPIIEISKLQECELLSEFNTYITFSYRFSQGKAFEPTINTTKINIYELAHKVKEWAISMGYELLSTQGKDLASCGIYTQGNLQHEIDGAIAKAEPEAIFQAGEWILQNIARKIQ